MNEHTVIKGQTIHCLDFAKDLLCLASRTRLESRACFRRVRYILIESCRSESRKWNVNIDNTRHDTTCLHEVEVIGFWVLRTDCAVVDICVLQFCLRVQGLGKVGSEDRNVSS